MTGRTYKILFLFYFIYLTPISFYTLRIYIWSFTEPVPPINLHYGLS